MPGTAALDDKNKILNRERWRFSKEVSNAAMIGYVETKAVMDIKKPGDEPGFVL